MSLKKAAIVPFALFPFAVVLSCSSISLSSAQQHLKAGNYPGAVFQAVESLTYDPKNQEAITFLESIFPRAISEQLELVKNAEISTSPFRFDAVVNAIRQIHTMNDAVAKLPPLVEKKSNRIISFSISYIRDDLAVAEKMAAQAHYDEGLRLSLGQGRASQRSAYAEFKKTGNFVPNFLDSTEQAAKARDLGSDRIVMLPFGDKSGSFFGASAAGLLYDSMTQEMLKLRSGKTFTQLVDRSRLERAMASQSISVSAAFDQDLSARIGSLLSANILVHGQLNSITIPTPVQNSVTSEVQRIIQVPDPNGSGTVPLTVSATITITQWQSSAGLSFSCRAVNIETGELVSVFSDSARRHDDWKWLTFKGDSRALSPEELELSKRNPRQITQPTILLEAACLELAARAAGDCLRNFQ